MNRVANIFFIASLIFAPLAFGTSEQWSMAVLQLLVCCSLLGFVFFALRGDENSLVKVPGLLPLLLLLGWMFFQLLPLPPSVVQIISPSTYSIYQPIYEVAGQDRWFSLTVNQKASLFEGMRIATCVLFYFLTVQLLSNGKRLKRTVLIVSYLAIFIAFLAIIQKFTSSGKIYWFRSTPVNAGTTGPWVYHNHYAGFMEMICPVVIALFLFYRPVLDDIKTIRGRIAAVFAMPGSNLHFFLGFGILIILSSIFISLSRGGIISLSVALIFFLAVVPQRVLRSRVTMFGFLFSCVVLMGAWFGWDAVAEKFGKTFTESGSITNVRFFLWQDSLAIIRDFLITGTGFGTYLHIYPSYKTLTVDLIFDHAHNDYLELLTDGGLIGFVFAAWFVMAVLIHGWKKLRLRQDRYAIFLSAGALTGIVSLLFHSVTDFNMHNGANALYFFFLCGLVVSGGNTRLLYRTRPTLLKKIEESARQKVILLGAAILLGGGAIIVRGGALVAANQFSQVAHVYLNKSLSDEKLRNVASISKSASRYDPFEGKYISALGNVQVFQNQLGNAMSTFVRAAWRNPLSGIFLQRLALMLTTEKREAAEELMKISYNRALDKDALVLTWAEWLLYLNERQKAITMLHQVFAEKNQLVEKFMPILSSYSFNRQEMIAMLPNSVRAWASYGDLVEKSGNIEGSEFYRKHALDFLDREEKVRSWYFTQLYGYYYRNKKYDEAFSVLREASKRLPQNAKLHVYLGDHYRRDGILYRAIEEYERALLLEPADKKTRDKLEKLQKNK